METQLPLFLIPLLPLLGAAVNLLAGRKLHRDTVGLIACLAVGASAFVALYGVFAGVVPLWRAGDAHPQLTETVYTWLHAGDGFNVDVAFLLDPLSSVMVLVVTVIGFFIHLYATGYMSEDRDYARFFGYFNLFLGAMLILVLGDSLPIAFVGWEGVGVSSFLLIGFWYGELKNADAGRKAMVVNRIGDLFFLIGIFLAIYLVGDLHFGAIDAATHGGALDSSGPGGWLMFGAQRGVPWALVIGLCFFLAACGKSAQIPLYVWLPDAMAGPTPVSALMHAATMVTAGVYLMARLHFVVVQSTTLMVVIALTGAATALLAATIACAQTDIKKVLAYSTVSQLGFMMIAIGVGAFGAGIFHLVTHAFFKGLLFLCAGSVMHAMGGKTEMPEMGGLRKRMPVTSITFLIGTLAIAGAPLFSGFFSKDELLGAALGASERLHDWPPALAWLVYGIGLVAAGFTAFYMFRAYFLTFEGECRADHETQHHIHESPASMTVPLGVLAFGAVFAGMVLGWPGEHHFLHSWFQPLFGEPFAITRAGATVVESMGREIGLMGVATLVAAAGFALSWRMYGKGPSAAAASFAARRPALYRWVRNKYYVDEAYDRTFVRGFRGTARGLALFDRFAIDGLVVHGSAQAVGLGGRVARAFQNGDVQRYLVGVLAGAAAILFFATRPPASFTAQPDRFAPLTVHFDASRDTSGVARQLRYEWDFDGDGKYDKAGSSPTEDHTYARPGTYSVRLRVTDERWGRSVEHTVQVEAGTPPAQERM